MAGNGGERAPPSSGGPPPPASGKLSGPVVGWVIWSGDPGGGRLSLPPLDSFSFIPLRLLRFSFPMALFVGPPPMSAQAFVVRLATYLSEEHVEEAVAAFLSERAAAMGLGSGPSEEEFHLEAHSAWQDYTRLIDGKLEEFRAREDVDDDAFRALCKAASEADSSCDQFLEFLTASFEFGSFVKLAKAFLSEMAETLEQLPKTGPLDESNDLDGDLEDGGNDDAPARLGPDADRDAGDVAYM